MRQATSRIKDNEMIRSEDIPLFLYAVFVSVVFAALLLPVLLQFLGLPWAPFAALICGLSARRKGLDVRRHALAGALYSALLFWPWVYFILRMNGRNAPSALVRLFYISVFGLWMVGGVIMTLFLVVVLTTAIEMHHTPTTAQSLLASMMYAIPLLNLALWVFSLIRFTRRRKSASGGSGALIGREYLIPPALAILSIGMVAAVLVLGEVLASGIPLRRNW